MTESSVDFFVSYTQTDRLWAVWIAWRLEHEGYRVLLQAWDFRPGSNFVLEMQRATVAAARTIVVLTPAFLNAMYTQAEWAAAFASDPNGARRQLVPVRVEECTPDGLLGQILYVDLVGADEKTAISRLVEGLSKERPKPYYSPEFPGTSPQPIFPGGLSKLDGAVKTRRHGRAVTARHRRLSIGVACSMVLVVVLLVSKPLIDQRTQKQPVAEDAVKRTEPGLSPQTKASSGESTSRTEVPLRDSTAEEDLALFKAQVLRESQEREDRLNAEREQYEADIYEKLDRSLYILDWRKDVHSMVVPRASYDGPERFWALAETAPSCWEITHDGKLDPDWNRTGVRGRGVHSIKTAFGTIAYYDAYGHVAFLEATGATDGMRAELRFEPGKSGFTLPNDWTTGWMSLPILRRADRHVIVLATTCEETIKQQRQWMVWTPPASHDSQALKNQPFIPTIRLSWSLKPQPATAVSKDQRIPPFVATVRTVRGSTEMFRQDFALEIDDPADRYGGGQMLMWIRQKRRP